MRVAVDEYSFVYVKLALLKSLLMTPEDTQKIKTFDNLDALGTFTKRFFPNFSPKEHNLIEFERSLWNIYFDIIEKIIVASPESIQIFLKSLLVRYEIWNIKQAIYGIIEKTPLDTILDQIYFKPGILLERDVFISNLIKAKNMKGIYTTIKNTPYDKIIKIGLQEFEKSGENFYFENELDKFNFTNMIEKIDYLPHREKKLIAPYINTQIDYYNLNLIYRTLYNGIPVESIKPYIIYQSYLFSTSQINQLCSSRSLEEFLSYLANFLKSEKEYDFLSELLEKPDPEIWVKLSTYFLNQFLMYFKEGIISDIQISSLALIFQIILLKEMEIKDIRAQVVKLSIL
ncbi:V-type ATPase subunit [Promethearchaeum syntrophicum]|uniref:V-type ATPase subunit n=1 Tax=Promethearchaeum syntrophicum TaxID=2594042 RepID=A0A5B9D9V3_9ARCH|nr:V-type ATPase subunit [Candidatus Prometheoarchaeum syntrophicum]QEE15873.1 V-type ATP synthase subunit C [Candidatus Prometheoarchaeum syntrophicum]